MADVRIDAASADDVEAIQKGLSAFNRSKAPPPRQPDTLNYAVRNENGALLGGMIARAFMGSVHVEVLWLDEAARGKGIGSALMARVERDAKAVGADYSWLDTLTWQARPFYEKLGYTVFAELPVLGGKYQRFFMRKDL